jgi:hypothetical protein
MDTQNFNKDLDKKVEPTLDKTGSKEKLSHKVGDAIEHLGDYVGNRVSKTAGEKIRNLGDKIEHSQD